MYQVEIIPPAGDEDRVKYRLLEEIELLGYKVPAGFVSDGATTPRFMWAWIPPVDKYFPAAVVHDYLLETTNIRRKDIDKIFYQCLKALNISFLVRYAMYIGVRINSILKHQLLKGIL